MINLAIEIFFVKPINEGKYDSPLGFLTKSDLICLGKQDND